MVRLHPKSVLPPPAKKVWQRPANVDLESMVRLRPESDLPMPEVDSTAPRRLPMAELHHRPAVVHGPVTVDVRGEPAGWKPARAWIAA